MDMCGAGTRRAFEYGRILNMELLGKRRGRPKRRFMDVVREDLQMRWLE